MILLKLFYFLKGYVIIRERAFSMVKLINIAHSNGIFLWNASADSAYIKKRDLEKLQKLASRYGLSVEIVKTVSFYDRFIKNYGWLFLTSAAVVLSFFLIASGYVWNIEVNGCKDPKKSEILAALETEGLTIGAWKFSLPSGNTLRDRVIYNVDGVNWAWVYFDGITARVEVSVGKAAPQIVKDKEPCNLVALSDGIITHVIAEKGRTLLPKGSHVSAGDIIVSGAMPGGEKHPPYTVHAEGKVYAETLHTKSKTASLYKSYTKDTGEEYTYRTLRLFSIEIPLSRQKVPFTEYRTERDITPFGICTYHYIETETEVKQIPEELAIKEASEDLYEEIAHELTPGAQKQAEDIRTSRITEDKVKVTLSMSFIENIATKSKIEEWQTEELTDDKAD